MNIHMLRQTQAVDTPDAEAQRRDHELDRQSNVSFWYSKRTATFFVISLVLIVAPISFLIPPFQSPDEFNHIQRAYLLSKGHVFLNAIDNQTGGNIDSGLLAYMDLFRKLPFKYEEKITQSLIRNSKRASWSGEEQFSALPNSAVYFPFSYLPQATAFLIGRHSGLSISETYYLARALSLAAALAMLWWALILYPVPLPVLALFGMPMALFQLGSASLDAVSFAMCALTGSLFMRAADVRFRFSHLMHVALILCLLLISTSRTNLVGLIWLPMVLYSLRHSRSYLISTGILIALSLSWIAFVTLTVEGLQIQEMSPVRILSFYLSHIGTFFSVMLSTITNGVILLGYWNMFVGVLGWLDTPLDPSLYSAFAALFAALAIVSIQTSKLSLMKGGHVALSLGAALSTMLLFVLFLVTYTIHPATVVDSIQGRYFYPMAILLGFALFDRRLSPNRVRIGNCILFVIATLSIVSTAPKLIGRYWAS